MSFGIRDGDAEFFLGQISPLYGFFQMGKAVIPKAYIDTRLQSHSPLKHIVACQKIQPVDSSSYSACYGV